jgi:hypothetical protein
MSVKNVDLGYRPRPWQDQIHREIKRFSIAIVHRRGGKTVAAKMELIHRCLSKPKTECAYIAPYLTQARRVMWGPLREMCMLIPHTECRETDMLVTFANGSTIRCMGSDNSESVRGLGFDFVVGDEYADWAPDVLTMVVMPTLAGRDGGLLLIGTPKGIDPLTEMYEKQKKNPDWACWKFNVEQTHALSHEEVEIMRSAMTPATFRLEMMCDFDAGSPGQLISGDVVEAAFARSYDYEQYRLHPRIMGCDIARQGDDSTVIFKRQGPMSWEPTAFQETNLMVTARRIAEEWQLFHGDALFIDGGGVGAGAVDALREMGIPVIEIQFGSKASDPRFMNMRAEMWFNMYHWLRSGGRLHPDPAIKVELTAPNHWTNDKGQTQLESKDDIKKRGMKSPDRADGLALTFAMPVQTTHERKEQPTRAKDDWDIWR